MRSRHVPALCTNCSSLAAFIMSSPNVSVWDASRKFPNLRKSGDGTMQFGTKLEYETYLKKNDIVELSTDAPVYRPHGNRVVSSDRSTSRNGRKRCQKKKRPRKPTK